MTFKKANKKTFPQYSFDHLIPQKEVYITLCDDLTHDTLSRGDMSLSQSFLFL